MVDVEAEVEVEEASPRRELTSSERSPRRRDAVDAALRRSATATGVRAQIDEHLEERGFDEDERREALATLARTGLVDDRRFAEPRAAALAGRGAGDALIRHDLRGAGVDDGSSWTPRSRRSRASTTGRDRIVERRGVDREDRALPAREGVLRGGRRGASLRGPEDEALG